MAGAKLPPRQKMIGLMYLVLLALLALNVSKDILDAFILVNDGLETTITNYEEKNQLLYNEFNNAKTIDPVKVAPYWKKAMEAKLLSEELNDYIIKLKSNLIMETEQLTQHEADTIQLAYVNGKDNYDVPTRLLIGSIEDGSTGLANSLKTKINTYKQNLLALLSDSERKETILDLKTSDISTSDGLRNWEIENFHNTPLAASITLLSKIQTDVKNAEFDIVNKLYQSVRKNDFTFDTIAPKVISSSNYVLIGDNYQSDIFVAAFSRTQDPQIIIGKLDENEQLIEAYDTLDISNGMGKYSIAPKSEGVHDYEGIININTPSGETKRYPFRSSFIAAKPSLVVSPDAMNVLYIGPDNPISISVPGVSSDKLIATITGTGNKLTKLSNGKYKAVLSRNSPTNVKISVSIKDENNETKSMGNMPFVTKKLPKPSVSFLVESGAFNKSANDMKRATALSVSYGSSFVFTGLPINVRSFKVEIMRGGDNILSETCSGKMLCPKVKEAFRNLRRNDIVYFTDVVATEVSGSNVSAESIIKIKINR